MRKVVPQASFFGVALVSKTMLAYLQQKRKKKDERTKKQFRDQGVWYPQMRREEMDRPPDTTGDI